MWRVLWVLLLVLMCACATTGTGIGASEGYSPSSSHFWCGEKCVVAAGCEEGLICGCVKFYNGREEVITRAQAETELWNYAVAQLCDKLNPNVTVEELRQQPHEIREITTTFGSKSVCGTFPRYAQFGKYPEATTVKSGEVVTVIHAPTSKEELQRWRGISHISTRDFDFVSHTYSVVEGDNRIEMVCRFRPGCYNYHLTPNVGAEQDDAACVDISTCRICEKIQNWSADESAVPWAKECLATGKQAMAITISSQPATPEEAEEPDF